MLNYAIGMSYIFSHGFSIVFDEVEVESFSNQVIEKEREDSFPKVNAQDA